MKLTLTPRQRQIIRMLLSGDSFYQETQKRSPISMRVIAKYLGITESAVAKYLFLAFDKLNRSCQIELLVLILGDRNLLNQVFEQEEK